jgi:hypothetical protein
MAQDSLTIANALLVDEVRMMKTLTNQRNSYILFCRHAALAGLLLVSLGGAAWAAPPSPSTINKLALNAYCSEAQNESASLQEGRVSYKQVAALASNRALIEHPDVYRDSFAWKAKIVALLDQYGDEPTSQLCNEKPGPQS